MPAPWQGRAVEAWREGDSRGPWRGTLEIFTGGGKTLIALMALAEAARAVPSVRAQIIVPSEALAHQWIASIREHTTIRPDEVGLMGAGGDDAPGDVTVLVAVINTAAKKLPGLIRSGTENMLIVDECHRAGAPTFQRVLDVPARFRLGLSATPERDELDAEGEPASFDDQVVGRKLGEIVFTFDLGDAGRAGWLPEYRLDHHAVGLIRPERDRYERLSRQVDDLGDKLRDQTGRLDPRTAQRIAGSGGELANIASAWLGATAQRKDLLFRAKERERVAIRLTLRALDDANARVLLFHERVDEATVLFEQLSVPLGNRVGLEHSRLPDRARSDALARFRTGDVQVLVSVKSLVEGIDVPAADVGISVAASSSVRQRIQSLGRVLRRSSDRKVARMDLIYVADTVDDLIYAKEDWSEATGIDANTYWRWPLDPTAEPEKLPGPPRQPRPTEEQEWQRLERRVPDSPVAWLGVLPDLEYSVDTRGTVTNSRGEVIANPQGVTAMVQSVKGRAGGRFRVTPRHRLVLASAGGREGFMLAGQLAEPLRAWVERSGGPEFDAASAVPGSDYTGPANDQHGTFRIRSRRGGLIERRVDPRTWESAVTESPGQLAVNGRRLLEAWRKAMQSGMTFKVSETWDAWYLAEGRPKFLARVEGGFMWPTQEED